MAVLINEYENYHRRFPLLRAFAVPPLPLTRTYHVVYNAPLDSYSWLTHGETTENWHNTQPDAGVSPSAVR
jgi:hypothetical protein